MIDISGNEVFRKTPNAPRLSIQKPPNAPKMKVRRLKTNVINQKFEKEFPGYSIFQEQLTLK